MGTAPANLACIGDNTVDVYIDRGVMFPGGNAVNVAAIARRANVETAYVGCLSEDKYGDLILQALVAEGVDVSRCSRDSGANARALVRHVNNDRQFAGTIPGVRDKVPFNSDVLEYLSHFSIVHTSDNSELDDRLHVLSGLPGLLSYDFSNRWSRPERIKLAQFLDIAFLSASDLDDATCEVALRQWAQAGARMVVATRGEAGAIAFADDQLFRQSALSTTVIDTLGAGDGFVAGVLSALARGATPSLALKRGAELAALTCTVMGAFGHVQNASGADLVLP